MFQKILLSLQEGKNRFADSLNSRLLSLVGVLCREGEGLNEIGRRSTGDVVVRIDPRYFRPTEVETLLGDPSKAHEKLGWTPTTTLEELVAEMVINDLKEARKESTLRLQGFNVVGSMENPPSNPSTVSGAGERG